MQSSGRSRNSMKLSYHTSPCFCSGLKMVPDMPQPLFFTTPSLHGWKRKETAFCKYKTELRVTEIHCSQEKKWDFTPNHFSVILQSAIRSLSVCVLGQIGGDSFLHVVFRGFCPWSACCAVSSSRDADIMANCAEANFMSCSQEERSKRRAQQALSMLCPPTGSHLLNSPPLATFNNATSWGQVSKT